MVKTAENLDWLMQPYLIESSTEGMKPALMERLVNTSFSAIGKMFQNILVNTSWKISIKIEEDTSRLSLSSSVLVRVFMSNKEGQNLILTEFFLPEDIVEVVLRGIIGNMSLVHIKPGDIVLDW